MTEYGVKYIPDPNLCQITGTYWKICKNEDMWYITKDSLFFTDKRLGRQEP